MRRAISNLTTVAAVLVVAMNASASQKIMLADTADYAEPLCLRQYPNGGTMLHRCSNNWNSMKWVYHLGDLANGPAGGGQLQRVRYNFESERRCLSNADDPGGSDYDAVLEVCDFSGPSYEQSFAFLPSGQEKFRIVHLGDHTCLSVPSGVFEVGAPVRFEFCDPSLPRQEWFLPLYYSQNFDFYEDW